MNYTQETINELDELIVQEELQDEIRRLEKSWMDIKKVARYTSLSISTINRAVASGRLKTSKVTGKLLFKKEWVDGWLDG